MDSTSSAPRSAEAAGSPAREVRRIGLVAVHGIGDQGRFHFLDGLVRDLQLAFHAAASDGALVSVSLNTSGASLMGAAAPTLAEGPGPSAEIVIVEGPGGARETRIGVHEVWWGDVVDPPTPFQPLKFLAWGLAMWAVPLKDRPALKRPGPHSVGALLVEPEPPGGRSFVAKAGVRARLFLAAYLIVVVGIILRLGFALVRLVTRQNLPDPVMTAISYMSDIKLYTQPTSPEAVPLDHLGQHARFAIRGRMLRAVADAAAQDYERWWVLAHSLGSVVAFSGLMTPDALVPRYLDETRWRGLRRRDEKRLGAGREPVAFSAAGDAPRDTRVACPAWLEPHWHARRALLLERFAGLVTYGSPLDKFAMLWPAVIPISRDQTPFDGRPWYNFHDETDPVAGHLDSFDWAGNEKAGFKPRNVGYAAHPIPLLSHLRYLSVPREDQAGRYRKSNAAQDCLATRLAQWWLQAAWTPADAPHPDLTCGTGPRWLIAYPPPLLRTPALWRARSAWTWATWVALALLSPVLTAAVLIWMIGSDLMGRLVPEWLASGFAWVPDTVPALAATLAASAVTIVLTAGLLGYLTVFSNRDIDPDAPLAPLRRGRSSSGGGSAPKPAVKDAAPYA